MSISIEAAFDTCRKTFDNFLHEIKRLDDEGVEILPVLSWQDELGRLRIWAGNIGAYQNGHLSLDFRLRDSSHIRQQIINLLDQIPPILQDYLTTITGSDNADVESLSGRGSENGFPEAPSDPSIESLATIITCLFEMTVLVHNPAQPDRRIKADQAEVTCIEPLGCQPRGPVESTSDIDSAVVNVDQETSVDNLNKGQARHEPQSSYNQPSPLQINHVAQAKTRPTSSKSSDLYVSDSNELSNVGSRSYPDHYYPPDAGQRVLQPYTRSPPYPWLQTSGTYLDAQIMNPSLSGGSSGSNMSQETQASSVPSQGCSSNINRRPLLNETKLPDAYHRSIYGQIPSHRQTYLPPYAQDEADHISLT